MGGDGKRSRRGTAESVWGVGRGKEVVNLVVIVEDENKDKDRKEDGDDS